MKVSAIFKFSLLLGLSSIVNITLLPSLSYAQFGVGSAEERSCYMVYLKLTRESTTTRNRTVVNTAISLQEAWKKLQTCSDAQVLPDGTIRERSRWNVFRLNTEKSAKDIRGAVYELEGSISVISGPDMLTLKTINFGKLVEGSGGRFDRGRRSRY
jgi:hypothetical protein